MAGTVPETTYERWMRDEGIPVAKGYGVTDVRTLELGNWPRLGGRGAFIQLAGMEGLTGMYVVEIPPGESLKPERHMYEELLYVLAGHGSTEVWNGGCEQPEGKANYFEWQEGSLFAPPLNTWHRLHNTSGKEPALFLAATNAPLIIDVYHSPKFVFGCDYTFTDRYAGQADYFHVGSRVDSAQSRAWETNFIPDVRNASLDTQEKKGKGVDLTVYHTAENVLGGHVSEWPVGRYHKAHYHGGGAILLILRSRGYTLMWPPEAGIRPYESGQEGLVVRVDWQEGSVLSPPTRWFHQHFNTGHEPARQLALRYSAHKYPVGFYHSHSGGRVYLSVKEGGALIEYEDEDPKIRQFFISECEANGVEVPAF